MVKQQYDQSRTISASADTGMTSRKTAEENSLFGDLNKKKNISLALGPGKISQTETLFGF